ncbi:MAG: histidine kinase response regulator hybrid protein [Flavipsychrobacter sp.]|jgi:signal transduction histidine kinase|nr:histidine kinase response regulator hybrid protein [Flavipsychrobacter sp.]
MELAPVQTSGKEILRTGGEFHFPRIIDEAFFEHAFILAAQILDNPSALAGIIDTHGKCFKVQEGIPAVNDVFAFAVDEMQVVSNLAKDKRFNYNSLVTGAPNFVFYAGFPMLHQNGGAHCTFCIWATQPVKLSDAQTKALQSLAGIVGEHYEQAKKTAWQHQKIEELKVANAELDSFAGIAAHDLKSPLNAIISLTHLLKNNYGNALDEEGNEYISFLGMAASNLTELISGIQKYSRSTQVLSEQKDMINFTDLVEEVTMLLEIPANVSIQYEKNERKISSSHIALKQILLNLVDNAIRYNDKEQIKIEITLEEEKSSYTISVKDNGPGITGYSKDKVFDLFKTLQKKIKEKKDITIGLAIVKKLVEKLKGAIHIQSDEATGTTFIITIPK